MAEKLANPFLCVGKTVSEKRMTVAPAECKLKDPHGSKKCGLVLGLEREATLKEVQAISSIANIQTPSWKSCILRLQAGPVNSIDEVTEMSLLRSIG